MIAQITEVLLFLVEKAKQHFLSTQIIGTFVTLALMMALTMAVRRIKPHEWRDFFSRGVFTDAAYTIFYVGGLYSLFIGMPSYWLLSKAVSRYAPWLRVNAMSSLNPVVQFVIFWMVLDLVAYLVHRFAHANRFMWEFHKVHHSQEHLTPLTNYRFHFIDIVVRTSIQYIPAVILGVPPAGWVLVIWIQVAMEVITHGDIAWSYGVIGRLFTSPAFHRVHHSTDPAHFGRNFGISFATWDWLFGTAIADDRRPDSYGLPEPFSRGFVRQMIAPFPAAIRKVIPARRRQSAMNDAAAAPPRPA
jgi:sterol desaturase/sphingolipid hydroxylase (fatty acid hydroxylase superfamily)